MVKVFDKDSPDNKLSSKEDGAITIEGPSKEVEFAYQKTLPIPPL